MKFNELKREISKVSKGKMFSKEFLLLELSAHFGAVEKKCLEFICSDSEKIGNGANARIEEVLTTIVKLSSHVEYFGTISDIDNTEMMKDRNFYNFNNTPEEFYFLCCDFRYRISRIIISDLAFSETLNIESKHIEVLIDGLLIFCSSLGINLGYIAKNIVYNMIQLEENII